MLDLNLFYNYIDIFILVLLRISGYIFVSPFWGRREVPNVFKITFALYLTYVVVLSGRAEMALVATGYGQYLLLCGLEIVKGLIIGFLSSIFFSIFLVAGQIIDMLIGFQMGGLLDINYGVKVSQSARLLNIAALVVFLQLNGHLQMIGVLANSFTLMPIGSSIMIGDIYSLLASAFTFAYVIAFKISFPIILIILFSNVVLGIMIKFIPQLNIFAVGIPLKIVMGVYSLIYIVTPFVNYLDYIFSSMFGFMSNLYL